MRPAHLLDWVAALKNEWCDSLTVEALQGGGYIVSTPFLQRDGDGITIVLRETRDGWELRDEGITISHLDYDEFQITDSRLAAIGRLAGAYGATVVDGEILTLRLDSRPTVEDVADFVQISAQILGLPLSQQSPTVADEQFRTRARDDTVRMLARPADAVRNWYASEDARRLYPADLWVPSRDGGVATFYAAAAQKAESSVVTVYHLKEHNVGVTPVLIHDGSLSSKTLWRAQEAFDDQNVVAVDYRLTEVGPYTRVRRLLSERGVELAA